jgi:hypothetical protein
VEQHAEVPQITRIEQVFIYPRDVSHALPNSGR